MGEALIKRVKGKVKKEYKLAFLATFLIGLLTHIYKFTNFLPGLDSPFNFYSSQNMLGSGRWFLSIACGFSSYYDLPWINGLFSLIFMAITTVIIVNIFEIKNKAVIVLASGIMAVFPSVVVILIFEYTADGYFLAMALAALAVYVLKIGKNKIINIAVSAVLICLSCGIYQAYVSFTIVLFLCCLIKNLLDKDLPIKQYIRLIINQVTAVVVGLILYYVIWQICMLVQGVEVNNYKGIDNLGFMGFGHIIRSLKIIISELKALCIGKLFGGKTEIFSIINLAFIIFGVVAFIVALKKSKVYKSKAKILLIVLCLAALPFAIFMWLFASTDVLYGIRLEHSIVVLYIFALVLCDKYIKPKLSSLYGLLALVMIITLSVEANVAYFYMNIGYENSISEASRMTYCIDEVLENNKEVTQVAVIGERKELMRYDKWNSDRIPYLYVADIYKSVLITDRHTERFLKKIFNCNYKFADTNTKNQIYNTQEFKDMQLWSDSHKVEIIDDVAVIKLGEKY